MVGAPQSCRTEKPSVPNTVRVESTTPSWPYVRSISASSPYDPAANRPRVTSAASESQRTQTMFGSMRTRNRGAPLAASDASVNLVAHAHVEKSTRTESPEHGLAGSMETVIPATRMVLAAAGTAVEPASAARLRSVARTRTAECDGAAPRATSRARRA